MKNTLYYGDNLDVLREHVSDESVDLIYLDPPFTPTVDYNILFKTPDGDAAQAQLNAFIDTWQWGDSAALAFEEAIHTGTDAALLLRPLRGFLGEGQMLAYLSHMTLRLIEFHRCLGPTGSIYLHCDDTASHYLRMLMDAVFGRERFLNEISWKRTTSHNDPKRFGRITDKLLYSSKGKRKTFNVSYGEYSEAQLSRYKYEDWRGKYRAENLTAPHFSKTRTIEWRGTHPGDNRQWRFGIDELERLYSEGRILLRKDGTPRKDGLKEYLSEAKGQPLQDIWTDIAVGPTSGERLGYPTQKPLALLERIIETSSNKGDLVVDPFCGCGTTVHAAQNFSRRWIGIDVTHHAVSLIEERLKSAFPNLDFSVMGRPGDIGAAQDLARRDKYQFQWWATWLVGVQAYRGKKKGADRGIDGFMFYNDGPGGDPGMVIISVKGGESVGPAMIRDLVGVLDREEAELGLFVTLAEPTKAMVEEAASAGFITTRAHGKFRRVQICTIKDMLDGRFPHLPPEYHAPTREDIKRLKKVDPRQREFFYEFAGGAPDAPAQMPPIPMRTRRRRQRAG